MYPKLLNFHAVTVGHFSITLAKPCVCPLVYNMSINTSDDVIITSSIFTCVCVHIRLWAEVMIRWRLLQSLRLVLMQQLSVTMEICWLTCQLWFQMELLASSQAMSIWWERERERGGECYHTPLRIRYNYAMYSPLILSCTSYPTGLGCVCLGGSEHHESYSAQQACLHRDQGQRRDLTGSQKLFCCKLTTTTTTYSAILPPLPLSPQYIIIHAGLWQWPWCGAVSDCPRQSLRGSRLWYVLIQLSTGTCAYSVCVYTSLIWFDEYKISVLLLSFFPSMQCTTTAVLWSCLGSHTSTHRAEY